MLNVVDVVLLLIFVVSAWRGWQIGASRSVLGLAAAGVGLVGGLLLAQLLSRQLTPLTSLGLTVLCVVVAMVVVGAVGSRLGDKFAAVVRRVHLGVVDSAAGAAVQVGIAAVLVWLVAAVLAATSITGLPQALADSTVLRGINNTLPSTERVTAELHRNGQRLVPADVLALLPASSGLMAAPMSASLDPTARKQGRSVVKVLTVGCGRGSEGTGFVTSYKGMDFVITNAHVVAGADQVTVSDSRGTNTAKVVVFDAGADLAVLRAPELSAPALPLTAGAVPNGTSATVLGYPRDGALTKSDAVIVQRARALTSTAGGPTMREIYRLRTQVDHGNSGSPVILADGHVAGVVNALSVRQADTGFALTADAVRTELARTAGNSSASTGGCAS